MRQRREAIQKEYDKIVKEFIADTSKSYYEQMVSAEERKIRLGVKNDAFETGRNILVDTAVDERIQARRWRLKSQGLQDEDRKLCNSVCTIVEDLLDDLEHVMTMNAFLELIYGHYVDHMDYRSPAKAEKADFVNRIIAVQDQIAALEDDLIPVKRCGGIMIDAMLGNHSKEVLSFRGSEKTKQQWDKYLEESGYRYLDGVSAKESPAYLVERIQKAALPVETVASIEIQSIDPKFGKEMVKAAQAQKVSKLSEDHRVIAAQNMDILLGTYFNEKKKRQLKANGMDVFDFVFVDGKSLNERYAEKYADMPYYRAAEMMKCELLSDMLQGKKTEIFMLDREKNPLIPLQIESKLPEIKKQQAAAAKKKGTDVPVYETQIQASLEKTAARTSEERRKQVMRMAHDQAPTREDLKPVKKSQVVSYKPIFSKESLYENYMKMRIPAGKVGECNPNDISKMSIEFDVFVVGLGYPNQMAGVFEQAGIKFRSELFYIDGEPAVDYVQKLYPGKVMNMNDGDTLSLVNAEILAAALSGEHQIETVTVGLDKKGAYQVGVNQVKMDLSDFDHTVKGQQMKPSDMVNQMFKTDKDKQNRQDKIRAHFSQKLAAGIVREMNKREAAAHELAKKEVAPIDLRLERLHRTNTEPHRQAEHMTYQDLLGPASPKKQTTTVQSGKQREKAKDGPKAMR